MNKLIKDYRLGGLQGRSVPSLFAFFGVHPPGRRIGYFGSLSATQIEWHLHDAHERYRDMMKTAHPDVSGNNAKAAQINVAWNTLVKRIRQKHPTLDPQAHTRRIFKKKSRARLSDEERHSARVASGKQLFQRWQKWWADQRPSVAEGTNG